MIIKKVNTKNEVLNFVKFPLKLYKGNDFFVPSLIAAEKRKILQIIKNNRKNFNAAFWYIEDKNKVCGRIAAFMQKQINPLVAKFSLFDCINDESAVKLLFSKVEEWAKNQGATAIHGPLGLTSFDKSGILIEGFNQIPTGFSCYNYEYYSELLEKNGFIKEFDWVEYLIKVPDKVPEKIIKGSELVKRRYGLQLIEANTVSEIKKYKDKIHKILNEAYSGLNGFVQLTNYQFDEIFNEFSKIIVPDFTALIQNSDGELIGFGLAIPSLSKVLIKAKGRLFLFAFWHIICEKTNTADLLLIAIKPEYQNKGGNALIFNKIIQSFIDWNIKYVESTKELENNSQIQNLWQDYEYKQHKRSRCYMKHLT